MQACPEGAAGVEVVVEVEGVVVVVVSSNAATVAGRTPVPTIWLGMSALVSFFLIPGERSLGETSLIHYRYRYAGKAFPLYHLPQAVFTRVRCFPIRVALGVVDTKPFSLATS